MGGNRLIKMSDFDDRVDVVPVADPNIFSMSQRVTLAQTELQLAQANPQIHNMHEAYRRMYEALGVRNIDALLQPEPDPPVPIDPAQENTAALQMQLPKAFAEQNHDAHIAAHMSFIRTRMVQSNPSVYALLQGHISEHVSLKAKKEIMDAFMKQPNLVQLQQVNPEEFAKQFESAVAERIVVLTDELVNQEMQFLGQQNQDPLVMLKQRELDLKAQDIARKAQETAARLDVETNKFESQQTIAEDKLNLQEEVQRGRLKLLQDKAREEKNKVNLKKVIKAKGGADLGKGATGMGSGNTGNTGNIGSDHSHSRFDVGSGYYGEKVTTTGDGKGGTKVNQPPPSNNPNDVEFKAPLPNIGPLSVAINLASYANYKGRQKFARRQGLYRDHYKTTGKKSLQPNSPQGKDYVKDAGYGKTAQTTPDRDGPPPIKPKPISPAAAKPATAAKPMLPYYMGFDFQSPMDPKKSRQIPGLKRGGLSGEKRFDHHLKRT